MIKGLKFVVKPQEVTVGMALEDAFEQYSSLRKKYDDIIAKADEALRLAKELSSIDEKLATPLLVAAQDLNAKVAGYRKEIRLANDLFTSIKNASYTNDFIRQYGSVIVPDDVVVGRCHANIYFNGMCIELHKLPEGTWMLDGIPIDILSMSPLFERFCFDMNSTPTYAGIRVCNGIGSNIEVEGWTNDKLYFVQDTTHYVTPITFTMSDNFGTYFEGVGVNGDFYRVWKVDVAR